MLATNLPIPPDPSELAPEDITLRVVIASKQRVRECRSCLLLFPYATVVVHEKEEDAYRTMLPDNVEIVSHPSSIWGIGPLKNWIMDRFEDEVLVFVDDDCRYMKVVAGFRTQSRVIRDPVAIHQVLLNSAYIAKSVGAPIFGYDQTSGDVRKFRPHDPFAFRGWVGAVLGIVGRDIRYDERLRIRADIDFCMQAQLTQRIIFVDKRFSFIHHQRFTHPGGNTGSRSEERSNKEMELLKEKWGKHVVFKPAKTTVRIMVNVKRRQSSLRPPEDPLAMASSIPTNGLLNKPPKAKKTKGSKKKKRSDYSEYDD